MTRGGAAGRSLNDRRTNLSISENWLSWCCLSSDSETISWKNLGVAGFRVPASIIPNYSGARKPDPTTLSRAVLPKLAVIFSVVIVIVNVSGPNGRVTAVTVGKRLYRS